MHDIKNMIKTSILKITYTDEGPKMHSRCRENKFDELI